MTGPQQVALEVVRASLRASGVLSMLRRPSVESLRKACSILSETDPEELIPELAAACWGGEPGEAISKLFLELAEKLPVGLWPRIEERIRMHLILARKSSGAGALVRGSPALTLIALCHPSGRLRERAIADAGSLPPLVAVSLLLIRVNDWAYPVRSRAVSAMAPALGRLGAAEKMRLVPLVERILSCGRHGKRQTLEAWRRSLVTPFDEAIWLDAWNRSSGKDRRFYLEVLKHAEGAHGKAVRDALLHGNDRTALLWYLKGVLPHLEGGDRIEAAQAISRSRAVPVRRAWLTHLVENSPGEAEPALVDALTDRSKSLRHFARFHLARLAPRDFAACYREALHTPRLEAAALRGLAEVAGEQAQHEVLLRLKSPVPAVRKAAIESLAPDLLGDHIETLLAELAGEIPGVVHAARKRLAEIAPLLGALLLAEPARVLGVPAKVHLVRIAPFFVKWDGLHFLLTQTLDSALRRESLEALDAWRRRERRSFVHLSAGRKQELSALLERVDLDERDADHLRFMLQKAE